MLVAEQVIKIIATINCLLLAVPGKYNLLCISAAMAELKGYGVKDRGAK